MIEGRILPYLASNIVSAEFYAVLFSSSSKYFTPVGLVLILAGILWVISSSSNFDRYKKSFLLGWFTMTVIYFIVMGRDLLAPHVYYFLPLLPVGCILIAGSIQWLFENITVLNKQAKLLFLALPIATLLGTFATLYLLSGYYASIKPEVDLYLKAAKQIKATTKPDELIIFNTEDIGWTYFIMYHARRRGWHLWQPQKRSSLKKMVEIWKSLGADYIYILSPKEYKYLPQGAFNEGFVESLRARYPEIPAVTEGKLLRLKTRLQ